MQHLHEVKMERQVANQLMRDCNLTSDANGQFDDKCGSNYLHLPVYKFRRETPDWQQRWRYRCGLQGNLFPGHLLQFSIVPPHIRTGASFGCTAYLTGLLQMHAMGKLGNEQVRQTDGGPDNDAKVTHAFHISLIHYGVLEKLTWIRLMTKHSHNLSDRCNSMIKEVIAPSKGERAAGCYAPWDLEEKVKTAMRTQHGTVNVAWHMGNYDFDKFFKGCIDPNFGGASAARYYVYENDPTCTTHGNVRMTYRETLLPHPQDSLEPEWKPVERAPDGPTPPCPRAPTPCTRPQSYSCNAAGSLQTMPQGHRVMKKFPSLSDEPPLEAFRFSEKSDVLEVGVAGDVAS